MTAEALSYFFSGALLGVVGFALGIAFPSIVAERRASRRDNRQSRERDREQQRVRSAVSRAERERLN
jgi:hypothetical protein